MAVFIYFRVSSLPYIKIDDKNGVRFVDMAGFLFYFRVLSPIQIDDKNGVQFLDMAVSRFSGFVPL